MGKFHNISSRWFF